MQPCWHITTAYVRGRRRCLTAPIVDAVRAMNDENVGVIFVLDSQKLVGLFTEGVSRVGGRNAVQ
jgi:hypothetical protein